ncbi:hypothetical protein MIDIC_470047 [Alphaproteobacteria bacterium]
MGLGITKVIECRKLSKIYFIIDFYKKFMLYHVISYLFLTYFE